MVEFCRPGWTFHSKGVWLYASDDAETDPLHPKANKNVDDNLLPLSTVVGSSNYGERGMMRDLEMSFVVTTTDERLRGDFQQEVDRLLTNTVAVSMQQLKGRFPPWFRTLLVTFGMRRFL